MLDIPSNPLPPRWTNLFGDAHRISSQQSAHIAAETPADAEAKLAESFAKYPHLSALAEKAPSFAISIAQAALLLYVRAYNDSDPNIAPKDAKRHQRKFSPEASYEHSLRVAEDSLAAVEGLIVDPAFLVKIAIKAILHDVIEDFKTTAGEIRQIFPNGWKIAEGVERMTTPSTRRLIGLYRDTAKGFIALEEFDLAPRFYLDALKKSDRNRYEGLKSSLKLRFKCEEAAKFTFDEAVIKCIDNPDSFLSYVKDIHERRIMVIEGDALGPPQKSQDGTYFGLTTAEAKRNFDDRAVYHAAVMQRFAELKKGQPEIPNLDAIVGRLDKHFQGSAAAFQKYIDYPVPATTPAFAPQ